MYIFSQRIEKKQLSKIVVFRDIYKNVLIFQIIKIKTIAQLKKTVTIFFYVPKRKSK